MGLFKWIWVHFIWIFIHGLGLMPNPLLDQDKFQFGTNNCPPHTFWPEGHIVCIKAPKNILLGLFSTKRPKIQLSTHDVEFQRHERAKSGQMRRQLLNPQEKFSAIIKFKPSTFVLPPSKDTVPPKNNHPTSSQSNPGSSSFFPRKNLFALSEITPFCLEKGKKTSFDLEK